MVLFRNYSAAADPVQRAGYMAAANYASAVLASPVEIVYAIVIPSLGILLAGFVMLNGIFNKITAWLGVMTGAMGILALTGWSYVIMANALFATAWLILVGYRLCRPAPR